MSAVSSGYLQSSGVDLHRALWLVLELATPEVEEKSSVNFEWCQACSEAAGRAPDPLAGAFDSDSLIYPYSTRGFD